MISDAKRERDIYICSKASLPKNMMLFLSTHSLPSIKFTKPTSFNMKAARLAFALFALPFAFAKVGDECTYKDLKGTCKDVGACTAGKKFHIFGGWDENERKRKKE